MKNFRYLLSACLCVSLLAISVNALASKSGCTSTEAAQAEASDETVSRQVVEEPAMAAIPPAQKGKESGKDGRQSEFPPVKEEPAMAAIPDK